MSIHTSFDPHTVTVKISEIFSVKPFLTVRSSGRPFSALKALAPFTKRSASELYSVCPPDVPSRNH